MKNIVKYVSAGLGKRAFVVGVVSVLLLSGNEASAQATSTGEVIDALKTELGFIITIAKWIMRTAAVLGAMVLVYTGFFDSDGERKLRGLISKYITVLIVWGILETLLLNA